MDRDFEIDPENLPSFELPLSFLQKLFEMTGDAENNKGFVLAYVGQDGDPMIASTCQNKIVEMGLRKALERYLDELEEGEMTFRLEGED